jgi:3-oxoadipate enol-lactonase
MPEGSAPVDGGVIAYEVAGDGPPVVLLHAGSWDGRMWDPQVEAFARAGHTVIRYDQRGYGRSTRPSAPYSPLRDHAQVLEHLGVSSAAMVGVSRGGRLSIDVALERPELVDALVLACSALSGYAWDAGPEIEAKLEAMERLVERGDLEAAVELELSVWTPLSTDPSTDRLIHDVAMENRHVDTIDWSLAKQLHPPAAERLGEIRAPALVIAADHDVLAFQDLARVIADGIPGARLALLEGADHLPNLRRPEVFNRLVLDFLASA